MADKLAEAGAKRLRDRRAELGAHAGEVSRLIRELEDDVDDLHSQEGWDGPTASGAHDWASDRGMVFRALRRNHFDVGKTHAFLLSALGERAERGLGGQLPAPPSNLWSLLPFSVTDKLDHPVALLSLREVSRDEAGSLLDLKDWTWWGLELVRRALRDWWIDGRRGTGAEGVVLIIDVAGAGYRNMEVELLPTLFSVGHNNFPGQIESVYIVNAGWSQLAMWNTVVKRVLPRSALDKVIFLQNREQTQTVFDLDSLPKALGGDGPEVDSDTMLRKFTRTHPHRSSRPASRAGSRGPSRSNSRAPSRGPSRGGSRAPSREPSVTRAAPSRSASTGSIADLYYTAPNSPSLSRAPSRPLSRRPSVGNSSSLGLAGLAMTKASDAAEPTDETSSSKPTTVEGAAGSTIQRIKSLSNFHLYLSPSRLAHRDLLSDSEDEEPKLQIVTQRRRSLRPAMFEGGIAARRAAARAAADSSSPSRASTPQESYIARLQAHHANVLEKYCEKTDISQLRLLDRSADSSMNGSVHSSTNTSPASVENDPTNQIILSTPEPENDVSTAPTTPAQDPVLKGTEVEPASDVQFSSTDNPWFGYPVVRVHNGAGYSIRPRYGRNRKRDLIKTLLWLFILRLQTMRASIESALGLNKVARLLKSRRTPQVEPRTPTEGLRDTAVARRVHTHAYPQSSKALVGRHHDWIWMLIGFLVCRGTWAPFIGSGLDSLGLGTFKEVLGLI